MNRKAEAEETSGSQKRSPLTRYFGPFPLFVWLAGVVLAIGICLVILVLLPSTPQFQQWQRELEITSAVSRSFPRLCPEGFVITDCRQGGCFFPATPGAEEYEISCRGNDSQFGPALHLNAETCEVTPISLTLASSMMPLNPNGKMTFCPRSRP